MAFAVRLYNFSKKRNSTAVPASGATYSQYNCTNKGVLDILNPVIVLKFTNDAEADTSNFIHKNYAYIPSFGRYYYVTGWSNTGPLWEAQLEVDPLASFRSEIGSETIYVLRSSFEKNGQLMDTVYPQLAEPIITQYDFPKVWTIGGANEAGIAANTCVVVAGIISGNSTKFYAMSWDNWEKLYTKIFSDDYYTAVLGEFGALEYPEAKVAISPLQYIASAIIVPTGIGASRYLIHYETQVSSIPVGTVTVTPNSPFSAYRLYNDPQPPDYYRFAIPSTGFYHPQAPTRGVWLNYTPATDYVLYFPPIGEIPLEPSLICFADALNVYLHYDYKAGTCMLDVNSQFNTGSANSYTMPLYRGEFPMGCPIQLSNVIKTGSSIMNESFLNGSSLIVNTLSKNSSIQSWLNYVGGQIPLAGNIIHNGIESAIHGAVPKLSSKGSFGSTASMGGIPRLIVTHWLYAQDDNESYGRPLCFKRKLSDIPGYIRADADELSIAGAMGPEVTAIREAVATGFYYE